ncbi:MAG: M28 family peptidase [Hyphomonadaceae bacterium]
MLTRAARALALLLLLAPLAGAQQGARLPAFTSPPLSPPALRAHVAALASDAAQGRFPGTAGEVAALSYIERAFNAAGLMPAMRDAEGRASFRQAVPMTVSTLSGAPSLRIAGGGAPLTLAYRTHFIAWSEHGDARIDLHDAPLVFVGYGLTAPALGWDQYAGEDMRGKIALMLANDPDFETGDDRGFGGRAMSAYGAEDEKFAEAAAHGAAGAFIVHDADAAGMPWAALSAARTGPLLRPAQDGAQSSLAAGWISAEAALTLFARAGVDFAALKARAQRPDFTATPLPLRVSMTLATQTQTIASPNLIGVLRGDARAQEAVLFTAHWDHLGACPPSGGDFICNGARPATGVAGLIELARRFRDDGRAARSIVFAAFTGETQGGLGSAYYAAHPAFPLARTVAAIDLESLGVDGPARDITLIAPGLSDLDDALIRAAQAQRRIVTPDRMAERGIFFRSSALAFARAGVPILVMAPGQDLRAGGVARGQALADAFIARRAQQPGDALSPQWDFVGGTQDLLLLHQVGRELADGAAWPAWRAHAPYARAQR